MEEERPPATMEEEHHPPTPTPLLQGQRWRHRLATNLRLKTTMWSELGGAVGDLGTYIPIVLSLTLVSHLDLSTTLIATTISVSENPHLSISQITAAGISTAVAETLTSPPPRSSPQESPRP